MALLTSSIILKTFMKELRGQSKYLKFVDKQYQDKFGELTGDVSKGGTTISVKTPQQYAVRNGRTSTFAAPDEGSRSLTVNTFRGVDLQFTDAELELSVDAFKERHINAAAATLAADIDQEIANASYKAFRRSLGTPGTTPSTVKLFNQARARLVDAYVPEGGKLGAFLNMDASVEVADAIKGLLNPTAGVSDAFENGFLGRAVGLNFFETAHCPSHTVGPLGGTPLVNGASQGIATGTAETTSLVTDGWTAAAAARLNAGDVINLAGVYDVDPYTKVARSYLKDFVVTADVSSDPSGNLTAVISPAIIRAGAYQNVSGAPADNAAITVKGTAATAYPQNLVFHEKAITFASVPLLVPRGTDMAERVQADGVSLRMVRDWDNAGANLNTRVDVFFGVAAMMPDWGVRVFG